jgi:hypothetical protein
MEEAKRTKDSAILLAEGEAQEQLVRDIKAAEAAEQAAKFRARERVTLADAEVEASEREARAKIRLAEGIQAEAAAAGLAEVRVREANALATEKVGLAETSVLREKGLAEANVLREKGLAEANMLRERLQAEAAGLAEKAEAMKALEGIERDREEFRLRLEHDRAIAGQAIDAQRAVAEAQASVLASALGNAKIDIIGGHDLVVDKLVGAVAMGKSFDGFVQRSDTLQALFADYLNGKASLPDDLKDILSRPAISSGDVQNLTVAALIARLISETDGKGKEGLGRLLEAAKEIGVDKLKL